MLIIAYLSCQNAMYLYQYASEVVTNVIILSVIMQIYKCVHGQAHIYMGVVRFVSIGLHL